MDTPNFLRPELFQDICSRIAEATNCTISVMDHMGIIVVSSDKSRIGGYHPGAHAIMKGEVDYYGVKPEDYCSKGEREGFSVPLEYNGERLAVLGVAAKYEHARKYAGIIQISMDAIFKNFFLDQQLKNELGEQVKARTSELANEIERHCKTEAELRKSQERFEDIARSIADGFWETDAEHRFSYIAGDVTKASGLDSHQILGRTRREVFGSLLTPFGLEQLTLLEKLMAEGKEFRDFFYEWEVDGDVVSVNLSGHPIYDSEGHFKGYRGTGSNITEQRRLQEAFKHAEKMAALGEMVAGIAHEINTPLGVCVTVISHLDQELTKLKTKYQEGKMSRNDLDLYIQEAQDAQYIMTSNLNRTAELVRSFKQVAVDQSSEHVRKFNLKDYLSEVLTSLRPKLNKTRHKVTLECPEDLIVEARPDIFSHILTNFITNSLIHGFAQKTEGHIQIKVALDKHRKTLKASYSDDGCGMDEATRKRIYEPFFTTKRGIGSGLGMHIIFNMVTDALHGTIECRSTLGQGTRFDIILPFEEKVMELSK